MTRTFHVKNRAVQVLLFPFLLASWMVGWAVLWAGTRKEAKRSPVEEDEDVSILFCDGEQDA